MKFLVSLITSLFFCGGSVFFNAHAQSSTSESEAEKSKPAYSTEYIVRPGDVLQVSIWKEPDMQREVLVRPDGRFSFPLAGEVNASGKTIRQLKTELKRGISKYIADPSIHIEVIQTQGNKIFVMGQVNRPGEFVMRGRVDVVQALSMAGGLTTFAKPGGIRVLRRDAKGQQRSIRFDYGDIEKGKKLTQNIVLISGDIIVVP